MQTKDLQLKRAVCTILLILLLSVMGMTKMQAQNITFADANVKAICVANWDTNGDGELNQTEATAVTSLDGVFMFDDEITSFDELSFFTGLTSIGEDEFNSCTSLAAISIPKIVTSIGNYAFSDCSSLASITTYAFTPPALGSNVFDNVPSNVVVNVPCNTSALYQAANGWSSFFNYEEFIYDLCPISFTDANVKAICVAHWDTNSDGELSYAEATAVTNLGTYFKSTSITSFDELEYFTNLTIIPNTAFYGCTSLASIALPSLVSALGNGSFYNCTNLATMTVYAETPPTVGTNAFKNVPSSMMVHVPCGAYDAYHNADGWSEIDNIQEYESCPIVFADANVKALCVANWDTDGDGELSYAEAAAVTDLEQVFRFNSTITSFNELQYFTGLTFIVGSAFYGCSGLASIIIPNTVTSIGYCAFYGCSGLLSIEIPISVTSIATYAFNGCSSLTSIVIPSSVISIGNQAFTTCSGLEQIVVDTGNPVYDSREECNAIIETSTNILVAGCKNTVILNSVTSIGINAFAGCSGLTSVVIPSSVTSIEYYAFYSCSNLTSIAIPNTVTSIGHNAFYYCSSLTSIEIPNSVTSIGQEAFLGCSGLEQIIVDAENPMYDSRNNCNAIIKTGTNELVMGCMNTVISNSVTSIGNYAFYGCSSLASIEIPNSVTLIGNYAFSGCNYLTSMMVLADNPPALGNNVFAGVNKSIPVFVPFGTVSAYQAASGWNEFTNYIDCGSPITFADDNVKAICVANWDTNGDGELSYAEAAEVTDLGQVFRNNSIIISFDELQYFTGLTSIGERAFSNCSGLTSIVIPNSVTIIEDYAFSGLISLTSMELPNHVTIIGEWAFAYCSNITSLSIGNSVATIGSSAFDYCIRLTSIEIPNSVISMNASSFSRCSGLELIIVDSGNTVYDSRNNCNAIINTSTNTLIMGCKNTVIPNTVTSIGGGAFRECTGLTSIEIPNSVVSIGGQAFSWCHNLTMIEIPSSVISIEEQNYQAFAHCIGLEQIIVAPGNMVYDSRENCNAIINTSTNELVSGCKNTVIPNSVTTIGYNAFNGCSSLTSIEIPNSVISIEPNAFGYCTGLTAITIPNTVTYIGGSAFNHCISLSSITVLANNPPVMAYGYGSAFYDVNKSIPVYVPCASMLAYQNAYDWSEFTNYMPATECESGEITIEANPTEGGTVTGGGYYEGGDMCTLIAAANEGYSFINWTKNGIQVSNNASFSIIVAGDASYVANFALGDFITFADANVKALCVVNWDTNGDGELSYAEAAAVTNLGQVFKNNSTITSFDELQYFTGLTSVGQHAFDYCTNLATITIPNSVTSIVQGAFQSCRGLTSITIPISVTSIGHSAFYGCSGMTYMTVDANNPPILGNNDVFAYINKSIPVYVPCGTSEAYQNVNGWSAFTNYIEMCPGTITIAASPTEGGVVTGGGSYEGGTTCTLTATASVGYYFVTWTENGEVVSSNAEYTFMVIGDRNLVANFIAIPPMPVNAEYYPNPNEPNSPYVKVHWAAASFEAQIGEGTSTFGYFPFYTLYNYSIAENLFLASELLEVGVTSSPMTSLSWYATNATGYEQQGISIWMANVSDTELTTTSHTVNGMTLVYTGAVTPEIGWNEFVFNEGNFTWDGVSNVLIFCQRNNGVWNSTVWWQSDDVGFTASSYRYQDSGPYNVNVANTMTTSTKRPNIIMKGSGAMTYNLYRANCDGTSVQQIAEDLNDTQYIDETWWQLANDSYKYGVSVADSTNTEIFWSNCIEKQGNMAVQATTLSQGWNWWSTYIEQNGSDGLTMLENSIGESGMTIKSQYAFVEYSGQTGMWMGGLASIDNASGYKVMVSEDCASVMSGDMVMPESHPTTLIPGWTWTGYPVTAAQTVTSALSDFEPVSGDIIKGQDAYASYSADLGWTPDNFMLNPGECYMYYSNATEVRNLIFSQGRGEVLQTSHEELYWKTDRHSYPDNLTMIATVTIDGEEQRGEDIELGAFVNGECRGSASLYYVEPIDRYIAFLTVTGQDDEEVEFKLTNPVRDIIFTSNDHITFRNNAIVGHLDQPFIVHFGAMNGLAEMNTDMYIYPNPIDRNAPFTLVIPEEEITTEVLVVNAMGEVVSHKSGSITRTLHGLSTAGVYLVKVTCKSGRVYQNRLIVK